MSAEGSVDWNAEDARFQRKLDAALGICLFFVAIASIAAWANAVYGTGWDPLEFKRALGDQTSFIVLVLLVSSAAMLGSWKLSSALLPQRHIDTHEG